MFAELNSKEVAVLKPFFDEPGLEASFREISRLSDVSPSWVSEIVSGLEKKRLLEVEESKTSKKVTTGEKFTELKKIYNLDALEDSGLVDFIEEELRPEAIILFGSYSRGEDNSSSDIDIATVNGREKNLDLRRFEEDLGRDINVQNLREPDSGDKEFRNSLANGTVLRGFLKVV